MVPGPTDGGTLRPAGCASQTRRTRADDEIRLEVVDLGLRQAEQPAPDLAVVLAEGWGCTPKPAVGRDVAEGHGAHRMRADHGMLERLVEAAGRQLWVGVRRAGVDDGRSGDASRCQCLDRDGEEPPGCHVYLDGRMVGLSPLSLENLEPKRYTVQLILTGYKTRERSVALYRGKTKSIDVLMEVVDDQKMKTSPDSE